MNNKYEKQFYSYDKYASQAQYIKDYWCTGLTGKLDNIDNNIDKAERGEDFYSDLKLVKYEITKYLKIKSDSLFTYSEYLTPEKVTHNVVKAAKDYTDRVKKYNIKIYNWANTTADNLKVKLQAKDMNAFLHFMNSNINKKLEEFVRAKNETDRIVEFKGKYVQKMDPIFRDPDNKFIKAHFYTPTKQVFGYNVSTYVVNVFVLWIMTILLYLALYFRVLKRLLDSGEVLMGKKGSD
jgi:hypothetical protein